MSTQFDLEDLINQTIAYIDQGKNNKILLSRPAFVIVPVEYLIDILGQLKWNKTAL